MLSLTLSRLFFVSFCVCLLLAAIQVIVVFKGKPIEFHFSNSTLQLGTTSVEAKAWRTNNHERNAPDSTVVYTVQTARDSLTSTGTLSLNFNNGSKRDMLDSMKTRWENNGDRFVLDTQITFFAERKYTEMADDLETTSFSTLGDGRAVVETVTGKRVRHDTFPDMRAAYTYSIAGEPNPRIREKISEETLDVAPSGTGQRILFFTYNLLKMACLALLLYAAFRLFHHFYRKRYFVPANVKLLGIAACLLVIPQLLNFLFYWFVLSKIQPVKVFSGGPINVAGDMVKTIADYQFQAGLEWTPILFGVGMFVITYIFSLATAEKKVTV